MLPDGIKLEQAWQRVLEPCRFEFTPAELQELIDALRRVLNFRSSAISNDDWFCLYGVLDTFESALIDKKDQFKVILEWEDDGSDY